MFNLRGVFGHTATWVGVCSPMRLRGVLACGTRCVRVRSRHHGIKKWSTNCWPSGRSCSDSHQDKGVLTYACDSEAYSPADPVRAQPGWMGGRVVEAGR